LKDAPEITVIGTVMECVREPLVPVMVNDCAPVTAANVADTL
jgi:hypothetical protein